MHLPVLRHRTAHWTVWLALVAIFYRALIPAGFMPANAEQARTGSVLVLCTGGLLKTIGTHDPSRPQAHTEIQCAFAAAVAPALPTTVGTLAALPPRNIVPAAKILRVARNGPRISPPARAPPTLS